MLKAVLFDLDGTLADTAPDLVAALNLQLAKFKRPLVTAAELRAIASHGTKAFIKLGFAIDESAPEFIALCQDYIEIYRNQSGKLTTLFPGVVEVLHYLKTRQLSWGIVTNKITSLTNVVLANLNLKDKTNCIVCGDTLSTAKPDPAPLLYACRLLNCTPAESLYIGDADFDLQAGYRAGIKTLYAAYGYGGSLQQTANQPAIYSLANPLALIDYLKNN